MEALFLRMLTLSAVCGAVLLPLLILGRRIRHRYAARTMYVLWLLMAVRLILPFQFQLPTPVVTVEAPSYTFELPAAPAAPAAPVLSGGQGGTAGVGVPAPSAAPAVPAAEPSTASLTEILAAVWIAGAALFAAWQIVSYLLARRALLRASTPAEEGARAALDGLRSELGVRRAVELRVTAKTASPVMLGLFRPVVLLPAGEEVPALVLRHELCHLKRLDVAYKGMMLLANAVHWFNPVVWWMAREAGRNLELCCDEAALRGVPADGRRAYGEILLRTAGGGASPAFSTRFGSGKKQLKERLSNLFQQKRTGGALVCMVLVLALALGSLVACESGGEDAAPLSPFDALVELEDSVAFDRETGNLTFVLPGGYAPASDWNIHVAGRMRMGDDGSGMSLHYFEGETWQPANTYTIGFTEEQTADLTELTLDATLPDPEAEQLGGERSVSVDLLAVIRAATTLYADTEYGFTLRLPESWQGKYVTAAEYGGGEGTIFRQKSHGANSGDIFTLYVEETAAFRAGWGDLSDEEIEKSFNGGGMIVFGDTGDYTVYAVFVSDMNYDATREDVAAEYEVLLRDAEAMDRTNFAAAPTAQRDTAAVDRTDLKACVGDAILQAQSWHVRNDFCTQANVILKTEVSGSRTMVYAMAEYQGFMGGPSGFEEFQGGIMPVAVTFDKNDAGEYRLVEYWQPVDGEGYWDSIRKMFPADIDDRDLDTQTYVEALTRECYAQAIAYWGVDTGPIVDALLEEIAASPDAALGVEGYPVLQYRELLYYGDYAVRRCFALFEQGGQTGLKGEVMKNLCVELLRLDPGDFPNDGTGQGWYDAYREGYSSVLWPTGDGDTDLDLAQNALAAFALERPEFDVLTVARCGSRYVLAARERPNEVVSYWAPEAFVMKETEDGWTVARSMNCDPSLSPGFSASVLHAEGLTVVIGDLGERFVIFPGGESSVDFDTVDVTLVYGGGQEFTANFAKGGPLLFVLDGTVEVEDLRFAVDGETVTSYQGIFGEAPEAYE